MVTVAQQEDEELGKDEIMQVIALSKQFVFNYGCNTNLLDGC